MDFNDLLEAQGIELKDVLVLRHRPSEPELRKVFPWLAGEQPDVFNAYQQTQGKKVENSMLRRKFIASFIGHEPGKALFIGLYEIGRSRSITHKQYWEVPAYKLMKSFGMRGFTGEGRSSILWFELSLLGFYQSWKGKLIISWPAPEISWFRNAESNKFPVLSIHEESMLQSVMPKWNDIVLTWEALSAIPATWRATLSQWRGVYYIFDTKSSKGYVGSAAGKDNILGRWTNYAKSGHGGNRLLRQQDPRHFRFSILQLLSPNEDIAEVIRIESGWKERLFTRAPHGLNDN